MIAGSGVSGPRGAVSQTPRIIWSLWFQGIEQAPPVVRECVESWRRQNLDWEFRLLDHGSVAEYLDLDLAQPPLVNLGDAHRSDLIRLHLLVRYGGVWADPTSFCVRPLDDWLPQAMGARFFAFSNVAPDRIIANWFLAAQPGEPLTSGLLQRLSSFWRDGRFVATRFRWLMVKVLNQMLNRRLSTTAIWFSRPVREWLGVYPYFVFHYLFAQLVRQDPVCAQAWATVPRIEADPCHRLQKFGLSRPIDASLEEWLAITDVPVHKLTWKLPAAVAPSDSVLEYLWRTDRGAPPGGTVG